MDPELPDELTPAPGHRAEAVAIFHDLYTALVPPAQRYFDQTAVNRSPKGGGT